MINQELKEYFEFDEGDLFANRNGSLSEKQLNRLTAGENAFRKNARGTGIIMFVVAAAGLAGGVAITVAAFSSPGEGLKVFSGLIFGVVWSYIWVRLGLGLMKPSYPVQNFKLSTIRGRMKLVIHANPDSDSDYELHVGELVFDVDEDIKDLIVNGNEYIVYYLDEIETIMSLELVPEGK